MSVSNMSKKNANIYRNYTTWQFGDRRSHNRIVLSSDPDKNVSSTGDMHNVTTLKNTKNKVAFQMKANTFKTPPYTATRQFNWTLTYQLTDLVHFVHIFIIVWHEVPVIPYLFQVIERMITVKSSHKLKATRTQLHILVSTITISTLLYWCIFGCFTLN